MKIPAGIMLRGLDRLLPAGNDEILGLEVATVTSDTPPVTVHKLIDPPGNDIQILTWWVPPVLGQRVWLLSTKSQRIIAGVHGGQAPFDPDTLFKVSGVDPGVSWDTLTSPGLHPYLMLSTQANGPVAGNGYYYVQVYQYAGSDVTQFAVPYLSTQPLAWRNRYNGVWGAWNYSDAGPTTGSNANGTWTKYPDGRLECWLRFTVTINSTTVTYPWTFPMAFLAGTSPAAWVIPSTSVPQNLQTSTNGTITPTGVEFKLYRSTSSGSTFEAYAYGRWK